MKNSVAHFTFDFLRLSESWIYNQIIHQKMFSSVVLCRNRYNEKEFPIKPAHEYPKWGNDKKQTLHKKFSSLSQRLTNKAFPHEENYYIDKINISNAKIIHAHYGPSGVFASKIKEKTGKPLVVTFYGSDIFKLTKQKYWQSKYKKLFKVADAFIVRSKRMQKKLNQLGCVNEKIHIINLGVDTKEIKYKKRAISKPSSFLIASRLEPIKGVIFAIKGFEKAQKTHRDIQLTIFGEGSEKQKIINYIQKQKIKNISLKSFISPSKLIKESYNYDIFLHTSISQKGVEEANPLAIIERMASGMPIIATKHGGISESVYDGKNGFLVDENDNNLLLEKIIELIEDREKRIQFGVTSRKIVEKKFNISKKTSSREALYQSLMTKK
ncbi:glycosyltransferase [Patescibacteria group bacterium]